VIGVSRVSFVETLHWLGLFKVDCGEARSILPCIECDCGELVITLPTALFVATVLLKLYVDLSTPMYL
jgi:hypothetical protein